MPIRVEIDLRRLGLHDRRLTVHAADAGAMMRINHAVLDCLDRSGRQVDDHEALAEIAGIGAQANEVRLELLQTGRGRHVESRQRLLVDDAGPVEAVAGLETNDSRLDEGIVNRPRARNLDRDRRVATSRWRRASTEAPFEPTRSSGPPGTVFHPPWSTIFW